MYWSKDIIDFPVDWDEDDSPKAEQYVAQALLVDAQNRFPEIIGHMNTSFSCQLRDYQNSLNARKSLVQPNEHVTIVDLDKYTVGLAYKLQNYQILTALLNENNMPVSFDPTWDPKITYNPPLSSSTTFQNDKAFEFKPQCVFFTDHGETYYYIIPPSDYALPFIPGFSEQQSFDFVKQHEGEHFLDNYFMTTHNFPNCQCPYIPNAKRYIEDSDYALRVQRTLKGEGLADIMALSSMIRNGESLQLIDTCMQKRKQDTDFGHRTADILQGFKAEITVIGEDVFRSLKEHDVEQLAVNTVETYSPKSDAIYGAAQMVYLGVSVLSLGLPDDILVQTESLALYFKMQTEHTETTPHLKKLGNDQLNVGSQSTPNFNPIQELTDRAIDFGGSITPESMAYGFLSALEDRRAQKKETVNIEHLTREMVILRDTFIEGVPYIAENEKYGLKVRFGKNNVPYFA